MCGSETPYDETTHVDQRVGYVEGAGQLCKNCYGLEKKFKNSPVECIMVPVYMIEDTPNDMELGAKIRQYYYESNS